MIVTLTWDQWKAIRTRIPDDVAEVMVEHRRARGRSHDYLLPAIGWKRVLDSLVEQCYGPLGGMRAGGRNSSVYRAVTKIAKAVGAIESHPALTAGLGVTGPNTDIVYAWKLPDGNYSPYPQDSKFVVLRPNMIQMTKGLEVTVWSAGDPDPSNMLENEAFHVVLSGGAHLGH